MWMRTTDDEFVNLAVAWFVYAWGHESDWHISVSFGGEDERVIKLMQPYESWEECSSAVERLVGQLNAEAPRAIEGS
jgi:hypothetical protein